MTIRNALILAAALFALTLAATWAEKAGLIGDQTSKRVVQVACGLIVVYFANLAPKAVEPLSAGCDPARVQAFQRFSGWTLVLGGLGYSLAWLVVPFDHAGIVAMAVLGASVALVVARYGWILASRQRGQPPAES